jgi:LysM repeat protein
MAFLKGLRPLTLLGLLLLLLLVSGLLFASLYLSGAGTSGATAGLLERIGFGANRGMPANAPAPPPPAATNTPAPAAAAPPAPPPAPTAAPAAVVPQQPVVVADAGDVDLSGDATVRAVDAAPAAANPSPVGDVSGAPCGTETTHTVVRGENLFRISLRYFTTTGSIAQRNGLASTRRISVGQQLNVLWCDQRGTGSGSVDGRRYVVRPGDNLFRIGLRFGRSAAQLRAANGLASNVIQVGQVLVIP